MTTTDELFSRGVASFIDPEGSFRKKVEAKIAGAYAGDIVIKLGVDPTRPDIHLGHAVLLRKLRSFQDMGCKVIFLIGDYTSQIGDPTGKSKVRPEISQKEIEANMRTYLDQVGKILKTDDAVFSWIRNSDWFTDVTDIEPSQSSFVRVGLTPINPKSFMGKAVIFENSRMQKTHLKSKIIHTVSFTRVLATLRHITHARLIERDMFRDRIESGSELYMHEMLYPVIQGIDSSVIATIYGSCDLEIGGTDQTFNMLIGRDVMRMNKQPEQAVLALDILRGLDGKEKMSKSLNNYIGIADASSDMYGKVLSVPDEAIPHYFMLATYAPLPEIREMQEALANGTLHPRDAKMRLAREIVAIYHGDKAAQAAQDDFVRTFSEGRAPEAVAEFVIPAGATMLDMLMAAQAAKSRSDARRLMEAGAVTNLDSGDKAKDPAAAAVPGTYRSGKHTFFRLK